MLTRRQTAGAVLSGLVVGTFLAFTLWTFLFSQPVDVAPPRYPTFEAAKPIAIDAAGRYRWPGTTVRVNEVDPRRLDIERHWLGMRESAVRVEQTQAGWDVGSPRAGPAHALQVLLGSLVPGLVAGMLTTRSLRHRTALPKRAGPEPGSAPVPG